jgi:predicted transcriptional regulator
MRTVVAPGGIPTFVNRHEGKVYESVTDRVCKDDLSERDVYLMQSLVNKNLVKKIIEGKKVYYQKARSI